MSATSCLVYPKPARRAVMTAWSARWRRRWSETIGPVFVDPATGDLVAVFPASMPPTPRIALQAEIEGRAHGTAQIVAACALACTRAPVTAEQARSWVRRWYAAGGTIRFGNHGWHLDQGFNTDETRAEWQIVRPMIFRLAFPGGVARSTPRGQRARR